MKKFEYHVSVRICDDAHYNDFSKSKWFMYKKSAIKYAMKYSGSATLYEYELDDNGKHHLISESAV